VPPRRPKRTVRFAFIVLLAALCTGLAAAGGWRYARASAPVNGPIILISIDTLRADHLPVYGYRRVKTPAIDALAADGAVFERAYSHAPQTLPAHTSLLSGRLPFETGVRDDMGFAVKAGERLLPQMLRERGYTTGAVVSSYALRKETGIGQGFDFFDSDLSSSSPELAAPQLQRDGAESETIAERWLELQSSPRVFLFLHLNEPHQPYSPPPQYAEYDPYDGEIAYADEIVGRLVRYLKSHQLYDRSTIVLLSDHGEGLGDHGEEGHGLFLYDETIHVPLIVKQAAGAGSGRRIPEIVQHIDIVPTILDLAKAPIAGNLRGRSLKTVLDGPGSLPKQAVYSEALFARYRFGWSVLTAITDERYRYINAPQDELYELKPDPRESDNLAEGTTSPASLRGTLDRLAAGATIQASRVSEAEREHFEALGAVGSHLDWTTDAQHDPVDPKDRLRIFDAYREVADLTARGRVASAVDVLKQTAASNPTMPDTWQELGHALVRAGRLEPAARAYEHAATLTRGNPTAFVYAAAALLKIGRLDEAQHDAEQALDVMSNGRGAMLASVEDLLARIATARRDFVAARTHAANAEQAEPSIPRVAFIEGLVLHNQGEYEDALTQFRKAEAVLNGKPVLLADLHFFAADALARLERWDEAATELVREIELFPRNLRARANLATAYRSAGRPEEAERALIELTAIAPTPEGFGVAARVWAAGGDVRRAEALRAEGRRRFRGDPTLKLLVQK
jgi:choline-sulfatase